MGVIKAGKQLVLETVFVQTPKGNINLSLEHSGFVFPEGTTSFVQTTQEVGNFTKVFFEKKDLSGLTLLRVISSIEVPIGEGLVHHHLLILVK